MSENVFPDPLNVLITNDPLKDYRLEAAKGNITGTTTDVIFGRNQDLDPGTTAMIWDYGPTQSVEVLLTADTELFISSSSASDTNVTFSIKVMSDLYVASIISHTFTSGQTQESIGNYFRITGVEVTGGSSPAGDIYIAESDTLTAGVPTTPALVHGWMAQDTGTTHKASGTIPADHTMYITGITRGTRRAEDCVFTLNIKSETAPDFVKKFDFPVYQNAKLEPFDPPYPITEKTDFYVSGLTSTNNTQGSVNIFYFLVDNTV